MVGADLAQQRGSFDIFGEIARMDSEALAFLERAGERDGLGTKLFAGEDQAVYVIGVAADLVRRVDESFEKLVEGQLAQHLRQFAFAHADEEQLAVFAFGIGGKGRQHLRPSPIGFQVIGRQDGDGARGFTALQHLISPIGAGQEIGFLKVSAVTGLFQPAVNPRGHLAVGFVVADEEVFHGYTCQKIRG